MTWQDVGLSRFDPLPRIIAYDAFSHGLRGWTQLIGNYETSLDTMLDGFKPITSPMLSTLGHWDTGSHGAMSGSYALKLATRARADAITVALKRLTFRRAGPIRLEFYATFKPEARTLTLSQRDVKAFGFLLDLQGGEGSAERVMPHLRYLNANGGVLEEKWQFKSGRPTLAPIGDTRETVSHFHLEDRGWQDLPGGAQKLCYNEIATKVNWHYLRFDFDLASMTATHLQCNDRMFDLRGFDAIRMPAMTNLWCMLNVCLFVETASDNRAFLYLDSICLSGDF
jgi:hypothetical protein